MPNTYFQFKQFIVHQEQAALKVSTDSCLFGAWAGQYVRNDLYNVRSTGYDVRHVLDIGAGTGLLMMMLAQQCDAQIDGVELDEQSFHQAQQNIRLSPWVNRLRLHHTDIRMYQPGQQYDFIISNPPFYEGDLRSTSETKNKAKHDTGLKLDELLQEVDRLLTKDGFFAVLLPFHRAELFIAKAAALHLHPDHQLLVRQSTTHSYFRAQLIFSRKEKEVQTEELSIKDASGQYTNDFVKLLKDYYLHL
ncbi:MAG: methyltransferase [Chitinophagaceae bacterium]